MSAPGDGGGTEGQRDHHRYRSRDLRCLPALAIVFSSVGIGYAREYGANAAAAALRARVRLRARVLRDGRPETIPVEAIVPGDVVLLSAGSLVPADALVLEATDFFVNEAVLTGESFPVEKRAGVVPPSTALAGRANSVWLGTNVRSGTARALVVATGPRTAFGAIAHRLTLRPPETEFDRGIRRFGYLLTSAMLVMVLVVFGVHMLAGRSAVETLLFSIALAVGLSPELLPAILSGARDRSRQPPRRCDPPGSPAGPGPCSEARGDPLRLRARRGLPRRRRERRAGDDVAREAADFVLLERHLDVIRRGIEEGRRTFANTLKYVLTTTSANLGNMVSMAAASLFLPFLPLVASQILLNNFLSDLPAVGLADDRVDPEFVDRPRRWDMGFIGRFMVEFGLLSSVFDVLTFAVLLGVFEATVGVFRTGWFVESLLTELVIALVVRTRRPCFRSRPGAVLLGTTVALVVITFAIPYVPLVAAFGFVPLPGALLATLGAITVLYVVAAELAKRWFYRSAA